MFRLRLGFIVVVTAVACFFTAALAQRGSGVPETLLERLRSPDWRMRSDAIDELAKDPRVLGSSAVKRALTQLLDEENKSLRDPRRPRRSEAEGDAYAEYYSSLLGRVDALVDPGDLQAVSVLAQSAYNGDSPFALKLASYGQTVAPALLAMAGDQTFKESDVYELLGQVLRQHRLRRSRYPLSPKTAADIEERLRAGLNDAVPFVRGSAIRGVSAAGDSGSLPILDRLQKADPYVVDVGSAKRYLIREEAAKAIAAIKEHPLTK